MTVSSAPRNPSTAYSPRRTRAPSTARREPPAYSAAALPPAAHVRDGAGDEVDPRATAEKPGLRAAAQLHFLQPVRAPGKCRAGGSSFHGDAVDLHMLGSAHLDRRRRVARGDDPRAPRSLSEKDDGAGDQQRLAIDALADAQERPVRSARQCGAERRKRTRGRTIRRSLRRLSREWKSNEQHHRRDLALLVGPRPGELAPGAERAQRKGGAHSRDRWLRSGH